MKKNKVITVFCGSSPGKDDTYLQFAKQLGKILAKENLTLVYGGASVGTMGSLADSVLENNGQVIGIIPKVIMELEVAHDQLTELITTDGMHQRKVIMYEKADAFLVLPGGFGTFDEMCEALTWSQLQIHKKKLILFNFNNFYDNFFKQMDVMVEEKFLSKEHMALVERVDDFDRLLISLQSLGS